MSKEVIWTNLVLNEFIEQAAGMTPEQEKVLRLHVAGWSRTKIADTMNFSVSTCDRCIAELKKLYDEVQRYDPILPPRAKYHKQLHAKK